MTYICDPADDAPAEEPTDLLDWIQEYLNDDMPADGPGEEDE